MFWECSDQQWHDQKCCLVTDDTVRTVKLSIHHFTTVLQLLYPVNSLCVYLAVMETQEELIAPVVTFQACKILHHCTIKHYTALRYLISLTELMYYSDWTFQTVIPTDTCSNMPTAAQCYFWFEHCLRGTINCYEMYTNVKLFNRGNVGRRIWINTP